MKIYKHKGMYGEGDCYVFEKIEDFDEYESTHDNEDTKRYNSNFWAFKEDFKKYIGKIWEDETNILYRLNGVPFYTQYKIIALEDDEAWDDWYWVVQNVNDERDIRHELANNAGFYGNIIDG